jgi:hypothetical protein
MDMLPVYMITPVQRCGSNFLANMLAIHPVFQIPRVLEEDFMLEHAHYLSEYLEQTYRRWKRLDWIRDPSAYREQLQNHLGNALRAFLMTEVDEGRRPLLRTPVADNVDKFPVFFPGAKLILLVRDGRDVVESATRKWRRTTWKHWAKEWARGVGLILEFMNGVGRGARGSTWELVKYEDLVAQPRQTLSSLLEFLGVDPQGFDWEKMERLPVFGSSWLRDERAKTGVFEKPEDFRPVGRWQHWGFWRRRTLQRLAGRELKALGYVSGSRW